MPKPPFLMGLAMGPIIQFKNVSKKYRDLRVLDNLSFDIEAGQKLALIGPSGSGKTTILRVLKTLETIDEGEILLDGEPLLHEYVAGKRIPAREPHLTRMREKTGMVFQHYNLFPHMTVLRNIVLPQLLSKKTPLAKAEATARQLLDKVGLVGKMDSYPAQLSGGQKQRVAIARAMALRPKIMLFDEVTSALDPELVNEVLSVLRMFAAETDMTMLLVTHEMEFAKSFADRILFFDGGSIVEDGPPSQLFHSPKELRTRRFLGRVGGRAIGG